MNMHFDFPDGSSLGFDGRNSILDTAGKSGSDARRMLDVIHALEKASEERGAEKLRRKIREILRITRVVETED